VPAHSFIATATAALRLGAVPVFVDIGRESYNLDFEKADAAVLPKTKAVIPVHFGGALVDIRQLEEFAAHHNLAVIEDAAHAHGAEWNGLRAGSFGVAGVFSFQNSKVMTAGEGGLVVTNDQALASRARSFANCGRKEDPWRISNRPANRSNRVRAASTASPSRSHPNSNPLGELASNMASACPPPPIVPSATRPPAHGRSASRTSATITGVCS
jgi:dTDP-4-amino-4,6-dideoxygalactose transaminase